MWRSAAGLAGAVLVAATTMASPVAAQEGDRLIPEGDWTDEQVMQMHELIAETEAVLPDRFPVQAGYDELAEVLGEMGYFEFGVSAPGGYDHWINPGWFFDDHVVDPEFPESLVYRQDTDGTWQLVSAMFMLDPAIGMDEIPEDIAWLPGWHGHPELCVQPDGTFGGVTDPEDPSCPPGTTQATTPLMMHVWIVDNDCGHRFGGVGVEGLHCDHGHGPGHEDPGHEDPGHEDPGHGHDPGSDDPTGHDSGHGHTPPPARPVTAAPMFTG